MALPEKITPEIIKLIGDAVNNGKMIEIFCNSRNEWIPALWAKSPGCRGTWVRGDKKSDIMIPLWPINYRELDRTITIYEK